MIPSTWAGFQATRRFRGVSYHITVRRVGTGSEYKLSVDGQPQEGTLVQLPGEGQTDVNVEVVLR